MRNPQLHEENFILQQIGTSESIKTPAPFDTCSSVGTSSSIHTLPSVGAPSLASAPSLVGIPEPFNVLSRLLALTSMTPRNWWIFLNRFLSLGMSGSSRDTISP